MCFLRCERGVTWVDFPFWGEIEGTVMAASSAERTGTCSSSPPTALAFAFVEG